jgi:hypothetical protein
VKQIREIRVELIIATLALVASAAASIATVVQTRVVGNQLSASVWPYLSFSTTVSPGRIGVSVDNDGLGPALVRSVRLTVDGTQMTSWHRVFGLLAKGMPRPRDGPHVRATIDESDISFGSVIRPGTSYSIIQVGNDLIDRAFAAEVQRRIDMQICYCSILGQCWIADLIAQDQPKPVNDCGPKGPGLTY